MSLTKADIRDDLLEYLGKEDATQLASEPLVLKRIIKSINATQSLFVKKAPKFASNQTLSELIHGPRAVTGLTLTTGSKVISGGSLGAGDVGKTFRIGAEETDNLLVSATALLDAYRGPTLVGTGVATLHGDCVPLAGSVIDVLGNVFLNDRVRLTPLGDKDESFMASRHGYGDYGNHPNLQGYRSQVQRAIVDQPYSYMLETQVGSTFSRQLRVYPPPDIAYTLRFDAKVGFPWVQAVDFDSPNYIPIPDDMMESIFLPLARADLMSHPSFRKELRDDVSTARDGALKLLANESLQAEGGATQARQPGF
jgi:hypothetical protein